MITDAEKTQFNIRAKASMREFLRSKSWMEKVESIKRMNEMSKKAKAAMKSASDLPENQRDNTAFDDGTV